MFLYDGGLYIIAYHVQRKRSFPLAIHRIQNIEKTKRWNAKKRVPEFSFSEYRKNSFGVFVSDKPEKVELEFLPDAAHYIDNRFWHLSQELTQPKNGNLILEMEVGITWELESWIMRWMPNVVILQPESLKKQVEKRLKESLAKFK